MFIAYRLARELNLSDWYLVLLLSRRFAKTSLKKLHDVVYVIYLKSGSPKILTRRFLTCETHVLSAAANTTLYYTSKMTRSPLM